MQNDRLYQLMADPASVAPHDEQWLRETARLHPWCTVARVLLLRLYRQENRAEAFTESFRELSVLLGAGKYNRLLYAPARREAVREAVSEPVGEPVLPEEVAQPELSEADAFELIEGFLEKEITRLVPCDDGPETGDLADEAPDPELPVTEMLAEIFLDQGLKKEAIAIYRKLSLINPEKNAYFAELIRSLENETGSGR